MRRRHTFLRLLAGVTLLAFDWLPLSIKRLCERRARQATAARGMCILWDSLSKKNRRRFLETVGVSDLIPDTENPRLDKIIRQRRKKERAS